MASQFQNIALPAFTHCMARCPQDEERDRVTYTGWDTTKTFLEEVMQQQGPFDGIMGFSQVEFASIA